MENTEQFRVRLQRELVDRIKKNPKYSIRAFAKALNIESSSLSQLINGKRPLTPKMCYRLGSKLNIAPDELNELLIKNLENTFSNFKYIDVDKFKVIADWYHYAILELTYLNNFKGDIKWISKSLGLSIPETQSAVDRLIRLGYLNITKEGSWKDQLGNANNLGNEFTAPAFRQLQKQILEKAITALEEVPFQDRVQSSMTLAVNKSKLKDAHKRILKFIDELNQYLGTGSQKEEVYHLSVSLYPVSQAQNGGKTK